MPCHAIAAAKHRPTYLRLRNIQMPNGPGNIFWTDDAANAMNNSGTAQRTESWIIEETAGPLDRSVRFSHGNISPSNAFKMRTDRSRPLRPG